MGHSLQRISNFVAVVSTMPVHTQADISCGHKPNLAWERKRRKPPVHFVLVCFNLVGRKSYPHHPQLPDATYRTVTIAPSNSGTPRSGDIDDTVRLFPVIEMLSFASAAFTARPTQRLLYGICSWDFWRLPGHSTFILTEWDFSLPHAPIAVDPAKALPMSGSNGWVLQSYIPPATTRN